MTTATVDLPRPASKMDFGDAITICLTEKYLQFRGRARRKEYWYYTSFMVITSFVTAMMDIEIGTNNLVVTIFTLITILPSTAVAIRRLHDVNLSGWYLLIGLVPIVQFGLLYFLVKRGTDGDNRFGPDPLATDDYGGWTGDDKTDFGRLIKKVEDFRDGWER